MNVGSVELHAVRDAVGLIATYAEAYPEVPAEAWAPYRELYPALFADEHWRLACRNYLLRSGSTTVLVDTGVGPPGLWDWTALSEGELPEALVAQLAPGGLMVLPLQGRVVRVTVRDGQPQVDPAPGAYRFVPLQTAQASGPPGRRWPWQRRAAD